MYVHDKQQWPLVPANVPSLESNQSPKLLQLTGHFGTKTVRHQYRMVPKCLEIIWHQFFTGAEMSGTSAEIPWDTSAPSVKWAIVSSE